VEQVQRFTSGAVAAGVTTANLLLGSLFMQPPQDSVIKFAASCAAAAAQDGLMTVRIGGRVVAQEMIVPVESIAGQGPTPLSTGPLYQGVAMAGELVELIIRNADTVNAIAAPGITVFASIDSIR
jgi:hypothetical protein